MGWGTHVGGVAGEGAKIIGARWVISSKDDLNDPDVRARLAAQEVSTHADTAFVAPTSPLEAKRMLFSDWAAAKPRMHTKTSFYRRTRSVFQWDAAPGALRQASC